MTGNDVVTGRSGIRLISDVKYEDVDVSQYDGIVLPGGLPNAHTLRDDERVIKDVKEFNDQGKLLCAICAAPCVFEKAGIIAGKKATSYPGAINEKSCKYKNKSVSVDGNIITSRGVGTAIDFALAILKALGEGDRAKEIAKGIIYK